MGVVKQISKKTWRFFGLTCLVISGLFGFFRESYAANFFVDFNSFYFSDAFKRNETATDTRTFLDFAVGFGVDKYSRFQVGWNYSLISASSPSGAGGSDTYSSAEMGPKFSYYFDKERNWGASLTYNLITNAKFSPAGGSGQNWRGTNLRFDVGYGLAFSEAFRLGLRLVYSMTSFREEIDEPTLNRISFARTLIYPAIHMSYLF